MKKYYKIGAFTMLAASVMAVIDIACVRPIHDVIAWIFLLGMVICFLGAISVARDTFGK